MAIYDSMIVFACGRTYSRFCVKWRKPSSYWVFYVYEVFGPSPGKFMVSLSSKFDLMIGVSVSFLQRDHCLFNFAQFFVNARRGKKVRLENVYLFFKR